MIDWELEAQIIEVVDLHDACIMREDRIGDRLARAELRSDTDSLYYHALEQALSENDTALLLAEQEVTILRWLQGIVCGK
jgi:hypothetical protein